MKKVRFKNIYIATAPHFEEHLLMELYCLRDHILEFFNLTVGEILLEHGHEQLASIAALQNFMHETTTTIQKLCQDFIEAFGPMYKEHRRVVFEDTETQPGFFILYYCVRIYFRNYASFTSILLYRSADWALSYRTECEKLYRDIFELIYPGAPFDIDMIELLDIFFVLNFGEKRCLFGQ